MFELVFKVLTGLGIFLFGMTYMEIALKEFASRNFKSIVKNYTSTNLRAVFTGAFATAILQSSSVVTLMTLSFVSASLISLRAGIGVIFGSNLGTTVTAWIVAIVGFKLKLEVFALPMVGIGALFYIFLEAKPKVASFAKIFIGFGLLFFGLDLIKNAIDVLASNIDIGAFNSYPIYFFLLLGLGITAIIQSSSATTAIILSALSANILNFEFAAVMMIGANVGTTVTAMLGAIGGIPDKKRAAAAHFFFNAVTAVLAFALLPVLTHFLLNILKFSGDLTTALALFHTIFNLLGVVTLFFFINKLADYLKGFFKYKQEHATKFIHLTDPNIADIAVVALKNEANHLFVKCMKYALLCVNVKANDLFKAEVNIKEVLSGNDILIEFDHKKNYDQIKSIESDIFEFVQKLNTLPLTPQESSGIEAVLSSVRATAYVAKLTKDIRNNAVEFTESESAPVHELFNQMRLNLLKCFRLYIDLSEKRIDETTLNTGFEEVLETNRKHLKEIASSFSSRDVKNALLISLSNTNRSFFIIYSSLREASAITTLQFDIENKQTSNEKEI